jgi:hypothetical protein
MMEIARPLINLILERTPGAVRFHGWPSYQGHGLDDIDSEALYPDPFLFLAPE